MKKEEKEIEASGKKQGLGQAQGWKQERGSRKSGAKDELTDSSAVAEKISGAAQAAGADENVIEAVEETAEKYLRLLAEFDNYKKRTAKQFEDQTRLANERIITNLLDVLDNFGRALDAAGNTEGSEGFLKGVKLIYSQLQEVLKREGLQEIEAESRPFDPRFHEAVHHVTTDKLEPDMVVEEIQKGYMLGDKVIRPSRVVVSREPHS